MQNEGLVHMRMCPRACRQLEEDGKSPDETIKKQDVLLLISTAVERQLPLKL